MAALPLAAGEFEGDEAARPGSDIVTEWPASARSGRTWQELLARSKPGGP